MLQVITLCYLPTHPSTLSSRSLIESSWVEIQQRGNSAPSFKMAATTETTCLEPNSSSEKGSPCPEKQEENEGRRMVFFRKVMRKCLDKIMAAGR